MSGEEDLALYLGLSLYVACLFRPRIKCGVTALWPSVALSLLARMALLPWDRGAARRAEGYVIQRPLLPPSSSAWLYFLGVSRAVHPPPGAIWMSSLSVAFRVRTSRR